MALQEHRPTPVKLRLERTKKELKVGFRWRNYLLGLGLVLLATLAGHLVQRFFAPANIIMIYLLCVTVSAVFGGFGPSILVSILGVLTFDFFFVPPYLTFEIADTQYIFTFIALLLVGLTISYLTSRVRRQTEIAQLRERETAALYALGRDLAISGDLDSYINAIVRRIKETLGHDVTIFLPDTQNRGALKPYKGDSNINVDNNINVDSNELNAAVRSFQQKKIVGHGTDMLRNAAARYLPLITARGAVGVIALSLTDKTDELTIEQERLLRAYADLAAVAIDGIRLADELHDARVLKATEKLQTALLNAISHDLRTPLVSVIGVLSSLQEEGIGLDDDAKRNLIQVASEEADRLNHLITNLLDESRLEAGAITLSKQLYEVQDLIGAALEQLGSRTGTHPIKIDIPAEMPFIDVDFGLLVQTLVNVLENALKFSPSDQPVEIKGRQADGEVHIEIADHGIGIPEQDLPHVFDKFYRIKRPDNVAGTGLGLSISKGIIEAHNGRIEAANRPGGGTIIKLMLPLNEQEGISEKVNE
jgi:two-component system sensor histidine kinase KdpD